MKGRFLVSVLLTIALVFAACGSDNSVAYSGQVTTIAGSPGIHDNVDGTGTAARFWLPKGGVLAGGFLYVSDTENNLIRKVSLGDNVQVTTLNLADNVTGAPFMLGRPAGIASDGSFLFVAEIDVPNVIRKISLADNKVTTLSVTADQAHAITTDNVWLYVADTLGGVIRKVSIATGQEVPFPLAESGSGVPAVFNEPSALAIDGQVLYVSDTANHAVRKVSLVDNTVTTLAGLSGTSGSADGVGTAARFFFPRGLALRGGTLYVSDEDNFTIRRIDLATGAVTTVAGRALVSGSADGAPLDARFNYAQGILWAGDALIVVDSDNHTIRKIVFP